MIQNKQFRELIVAPILKKMGAYSESAENLLVMVMSHESNGGSYLQQIGGPAYGIYQMEEASFNDIWRRYLFDKPELEDRLMMACNLHRIPDPQEMDGNLYLATAMARIFFLRVYTKIPSDTHLMSEYVKKYWNTELGKATPGQYLVAYLKFTGTS